MTSDPQSRTAHDPIVRGDYAPLVAAAPPPPPRRSPAWMPTAAFAAIVLLIGAVVAFAGDREGSGTDGPDEAATDGLVFELDGDSTGLAVAGPRDGLDSLRLPITVTPADGLADGQTVTVSGSQFPPGRALGVVMCSAHGPSPEGGVANCQISPYTSVTTDAQGNFTVDHVVRRYITLSNGVHDCAAEPPPGKAASCVVAVGAIDDYDQSGTTPVWFDPDIPATPPLSVVVEPLGPVAKGAAITITIENAAPHSTWWIDVCGTTEGDEVDQWGHSTQVAACTWGVPQLFSCVGETCDAPEPSGLALVADAEGRIVHTLPAPASVIGDGVTIDCRDLASWCHLSVRAADRSYENWFSIELIGAVAPPPVTDTTLAPTPGEERFTEPPVTETTLAAESAVVAEPASP